jgi:hypothetical protein
LVATERWTPSSSSLAPGVPSTSRDCRKGCLYSLSGTQTWPLELISPLLDRASGRRPGSRGPSLTSDAVGCFTFTLIAMWCLEKKRLGELLQARLCGAAPRSSPRPFPENPRPTSSRAASEASIVGDRGERVAQPWHECCRPAARPPSRRGRRSFPRGGVQIGLSNPVSAAAASVSLGPSRRTISGDHSLRRARELTAWSGRE